MRDKVKRFISILMTALMLVNLLPVGALAEGFKISNSVQSIAQKLSANVYVYVMVDASPELKKGLTINSSGWFTIGIASDVPDMGTPQRWKKYNLDEATKKKILDRLDHKYNTKIKLEDVTWFRLIGENGADGQDANHTFVPAGTPTFHLDGKIKIQSVPSQYRIEYVDWDNQDTVLEFSFVDGYMNGDHRTVTAPASLQNGVYSFYPVDGHPQTQTVTFEKQTDTLTFYYRQQTVKVNYSHKNGGDITRKDDYVQVLSGKVVDGDTVKNPEDVVSTAIPDEGYVFVGWYKQNAQGVENEFVSANRDLTAGDVTNHLNKKNGRYKSTVYQALFVEKSALEYTVYHRDAITHENIADPETKTATLDQYVAGMISANSQQKSIDGYTYKESPDFIKIPIENGENKLYLYYTRNSYDYTVHYYWNGTTEPVAGDTTGTLNAGDTKEVWPEEIEGYTPVLSEKQTITEGNNEITFYYYKNVTLTSASASKVYDGTALTNDTVTAVGFVGKDNVTCHVTGRVTNVADSPVTNTFTFMADKEIDSKYKITTSFGSLRVTKRPVKLTSGSASKTYDGTALTNDTVTAVGFVEGQGATYNVTGSQTEVGESANEFTYTLNEGTLAGNYTITPEYGTLKVNPVTDEVIVTITGKTGSHTYDGDSHTVMGYEVTNISNTLYKQSDIKFNGTAKAEGTDAGTYKMWLTDKDFENTSKNFSKVTFKVTDGSLTISPRSVTLTSGSAERVYNGEALTNGTVTAEGFVKDEGATYNVTGSRTDVGTSDNTFEYTLNNNTKKDNYTITKAEGKLTVNPVTDEVTVTITGHNDTVTYDGTEHKVTGYDVAISNGLYTEGDFSFSGTAEAKGTDADTYDMGLTADQFTNISDNFTNVTFVVEKDGQLVINPRSVTLTSGSAERVYNGEALTKDEVTASTGENEGFVKDEGAEYNVTGSQTEVGESKNTFSYTLKDGTNAKNYNIELALGTLKVTPVTDKVTVTITENSGTEKYDGTEKTVTGYTVTNISNPLYKESDFSFSGNAEVKGTDAGMYNMELKASDFTNNNTNFAEVKFVIVDGSLTISPRSVTLTSASASKTYDGKPLTNDTVAVGGDGFATDEGATYKVTGSQTLVGSSENTFTYTLNEGTKATNYNIELALGTLEVTPVTEEVIVTITGRTDEMPYDGKEHSVFGYDLTVSNALYNPKEDMQFNGIDADMTAKGTDAGTYPMDLTAEDFTNKSKNFSKVTFVVTDGYVKINPRAVTLTSETAGKTYDGTALEKPVVTVGGDGFVEGQVKEIKATGSVTNAGSVANTITFTPVEEKFNEKNYNIQKTEGTLTIAKRSVLITSQSATKTYDGSALTRPAVTITGDGFVPGELAKAEATGSITNVGSTPNAIQYTTTGAFNAANYSIALSVGTLTVTEKPQPEPRRTFNLTISYVYQNGKRAAASYNRGGLKNGETFDITSPVIAGYTASETVVSGTIYNRDIKVTVIYTADGVNLDDYGVPLGLGNITMNVGDCFE